MAPSLSITVAASVRSVEDVLASKPRSLKTDRSSETEILSLPLVLNLLNTFCTSSMSPREVSER
ncbi:hypothetical protein RHGRI_008544 [Rhododendron griersonianum]|uniref:Uncharacterized protein n=1 Tax=Rhododendron griersonianum TaxID=479676 RepID=A0AAV6L1V6_9ERIC|nr:hypothetical protein RHGRI_008544 [Rhododendron griersonianum]